MEITIVLILLIVGILFLLLELFLIPGISLAGIAGAGFMIGAVYYAYSQVGNFAGHATLLGGTLLTAVAIWIFLKSKTLEKMSLKAEIDGKIDPLAHIEIKAGDIGKCVSRLAPMGKVKINAEIIEAKSIDEFIDEDSLVKVVEVLQTNIVVEKYNN